MHLTDKNLSKPFHLNEKERRSSLEIARMHRKSGSPVTPADG